MATNTNLEKIDGAIALLEATESTLSRIDETDLLRGHIAVLSDSKLGLHIAKRSLQMMLEELKGKEGREPWQNSGT